MSIDYSRLAFPKGQPKVAQKRRQKATEATRDAEQRAICRSRSGGRCEAVRAGSRCRRKAVHNHHLKGGRGRRNVRDSQLAAWRADLCLTCHADVHAGLLEIAGPYPFIYEERAL